MRYLLVIQPMKIFYFPLGIPYINGAMRHAGFDVDAINLQFESGDPISALKRRIVERKIDVIMCGGLTTQYHSIKQIFKAAREANPEIITVGGGGGFSSEPVLFSEMTDADYAVIGEGEITNCELADALDHGKDVSNIAGLVYRKNGRYYTTSPRNYIRDVDSIPFPSYEGLSIEYYLDSQHVDGTYNTYGFFSDQPRIMPMTMARSCPFMCSFCYHPIGRGYRSRSLDSFFRELDIYVEKYNINGIGIVDECFTFDEKKVIEFCERIKPYNISWGCQTRAEAFKEELIRKMVDAGCFAALFGLESMSQTILEDMNKKTKVSLLQASMESGYRNGAGVRGNLLFGAEAETIETVFESLDWADKHTNYNIAAFAMISAYPGSTYYQHALKRGIIKDKRKFIEDGCPEINLTNLTEQQFRSIKFLTRIKDMEIHRKGKILSIKESKMGGYDLTGECFHCGAVNTYRGIESDIYFNGALKNIGCRKCHNFSDYVLDENDKRYQGSYLTTQWIYDRLRSVENDQLYKYISRNNIKNVALYGIYYSSIILNELKNMNVDVLYAIDRDYEKYNDQEIRVYGLENKLPSVDAIIILQFYYADEIRRSLKGKTDAIIVSIEEILEYNLNMGAQK